MWTCGIVLNVVFEGCVTLLDCVQVLTNYENIDQKQINRRSDKLKSLINLAETYKNETVLEKWFQNNKIPKSFIDK